jgi:hypothetical protein
MKVPNGRSSSSPMLLSDADVRIHLDAPSALAAIRRALVAHHEGAWSPPPDSRRNAGGIAPVNTVGSLSGFAAPYVTGWLKDYSGSTRPGLWLAGAMMILSAGLVAMLSRSRPGQVEDSAVAATTPVAPVLIAAPETPQQASTH